MAVRRTAPQCGALTIKPVAAGETAPGRGSQPAAGPLAGVRRTFAERPTKALLRLPLRLQQHLERAPLRGAGKCRRRFFQPEPR